MTFNINSNLGILVSMLVIVGVIFGVPIAHFISSFLNPGFHEDLPIKFELIENARLLLLNSVDIIAGLWLFFNSNNYNQHRATWLLLGLTFGLIAIILFLAITIFENLEEGKIDKINFPSFKSLIVFVMVLVILKLLKVLVDPWMARYTNPSGYAELRLYSGLLTWYFLAFEVLTRILLSFSLSNYLKDKDRASWFWGISCLVLGCFPAIVKVLMLVFNKLKKNVV